MEPADVHGLLGKGEPEKQGERTPIIESAQNGRSRAQLLLIRMGNLLGILPVSGKLTADLIDLLN